MLTVPRFRTKWGSNAFVVAAPPTWNSLPVNLITASTVTSFKKMLKFFFRFGSPPPHPNSSEIRRPVDDLHFHSRHFAGFDYFSILRLWARISEDLGAIEVSELIDGDTKEPKIKIMRGGAQRASWTE